MTRDEFRTVVKDVMSETLPKVNKRDRENFIELLLEEIEPELDADESRPDYDGGPLFDAYDDD